MDRPIFSFSLTASAQTYTLSLHDALPISATGPKSAWPPPTRMRTARWSSTPTTRRFLIGRRRLSSRRDERRGPATLGYTPAEGAPAECLGRGRAGMGSLYDGRSLRA